MGFNFSINWGRQIQSVERGQDGNYFYSFLESVFKGKDENINKIETVLSNPAALKVLKFNADTFSLGKINSYSNGKIKAEDYLYSVQPRPNDWQTWTDFLWTYCFYLQIGNAYLYKTNSVMYFLDPCGIEMSESQRKKFYQISFSKYGENSKKNTLSGSFKYRDKSGEKVTLDLKNLTVISDMTGISGDWFDGGSRLNALCDVVRNSKLSLKSKQINLEFSQKFLLSGQHDPDNVSTIPMSTAEKNNLEKITRGGRQVHATKSRVDLKHFVDNLAQLKLDDAYLNDLHIIGNMYGIPKDVLEALAKGATYENQEKSLGRHVDYNLKPMGQKLTDNLEMIFGVDDLRINYNHLPFNQVFEKERAETNKLKIENLTAAQALGLDEKTIKQKLSEIYETGTN